METICLKKILYMIFIIIAMRLVVRPHVISNKITLF